MPDFSTFKLSKYTDGTITIGIDPPTAIGGWDLRFKMTKEFNGVSGLVNKYVSSGLNAASGMSIVSSGDGVISIDINKADTSGLDYGNYAFVVDRYSSGFSTIVSNGYVILTP